MRVLRLALRRLAISLPCMMIILLGLFLLLQLAPGDAIDALMAQMGSGNPELAATLRQQYGLGGGTVSRLAFYFIDIVRLDLGFSVAFNKPVASVIFERMPVTLLLMISALAFAFAGGLIAGVFAARRVNRWPDTLISILALLLYATPSFWVGLMGILIFAVKLNWLPAGGVADLSAGYSGLRAVLDTAAHLVMPTLTLAFIYFAIYTRITRAAMLEVMTLDFIRTARAKGLKERAVLIRHALRNALLPMITILGLQAGGMLGGAVVVESVFTLPGLGRLAYEAVTQRDLNMLLGIVVMSSLLVIAINFIVDLLYTRIDPRIEALS